MKNSCDRMDVTGKGAGPDVVGRVMALEQKTRGLSGRVSALEMRFSSGSPGEAPDNTEFVPGERRPGPSIEERLSALEEAPGNKAPAKVSALDATGLVVGISLLAVGVLLSSGSFDLLKNPLLAFAAGITVLACAVWRLLAR
jgi:hypothetical protein